MSESQSWLASLSLALSPSLWRRWLWGSDWEDISEERMEEYRMLSGLKPKEIARLRRVFLSLTSAQDTLSLEVFLAMPCIVNNPLRHRIALCFGFNEDTHALDFERFLCGVALFNSPGQREAKLRTMFRVQDFDGDGLIGESDLVEYLRLIAENLSDEDRCRVAQNVLRESSSEETQRALSLADFQRVVAPSDFQAKMLIPI